MRANFLAKIIKHKRANMIITEKSLRKEIRKVLTELLGAKRKESILQQALGGTAYGGGEYGYYDDYDDYGYYGDYGYQDSEDGDDGDGDDGGGE